ncbi:hypothetical protein JOM56_015461 [Amanita muscaria]
MRSSATDGCNCRPSYHSTATTISWVLYPRNHAAGRVWPVLHVTRSLCNGDKVVVASILGKFVIPYTLLIPIAPHSAQCTFFANASRFDTPPVRAFFSNRNCFAWTLNSWLAEIPSSHLFLLPMRRQLKLEGIFPGKSQVTWRDGTHRRCDTVR